MHPSLYEHSRMLHFKADAIKLLYNLGFYCGVHCSAHLTLLYVYRVIAILGRVSTRDAPKGKCLREGAYHNVEIVNHKCCLHCNYML